MFKVNRNTRTRRCEVCSKLTIKTLERRHWHRSGVFMVNFLLLTLNRQMPTGEFNNQKDGWSHPVFTCSKSTLETPEQFVQNNKKSSQS